MSCDTIKLCVNHTRKVNATVKTFQSKHQPRRKSRAVAGLKLQPLYKDSATAIASRSSYVLLCFIYCVCVGDIVTMLLVLGSSLYKPAQSN